MQRQGEHAVLSARAPGKLILASVSESVSKTNTASYSREGVRFLGNKAVFENVALFAPKMWILQLYKIETVQRDWPPVPVEIEGARWILKVSVLYLLVYVYSWN